MHLSQGRVSFTLGDKIPIDIKKLSLGGNGANVSVGLSRLGIPTTFYTYIGSDILSQEIAENITREGVKIIAEKGNGYSSLSLIFDFDSDRIIYSHHPKESHTFSYDDEAPDVIYLTSIGDPWENVYRNVLTYIQKTSTRLAFSPGTPQLANMNDLFFETLHRSNSLFINREEAELILKTFGSSFTNIPDILKELHKLGPEVISVTDGKKGSYTLDASKNLYQITPFSTDGLHEKTGAGDAYATGYLAGLLEGKTTAEAMRQGSFNSYGVMQKVGATTGLLNSKDMQQLLNKHLQYQPIKI